jgi:hypothetical protein
MRRRALRLSVLVTAVLLLSVVAATPATAVPNCTVSNDNLVFVSNPGTYRSHMEQFCSPPGTFSQRLSAHNWQRLRWWGWETLVHHEPATNWTSNQFIQDTRTFSCVIGSGTYTYRSAGRGQFLDHQTGTIYTSALIISNTVRVNC